jgi:hypothetical protein
VQSRLAEGVTLLSQRYKRLVICTPAPLTVKLTVPSLCVLQSRLADGATLRQLRHLLIK